MEAWQGAGRRAGPLSACPWRGQTGQAPLAGAPAGVPDACPLLLGKDTWRKALLPSTPVNCLPAGPFPSAEAAARQSRIFRLCPETWGIDPLRHRFKILVNMSRLARSQVEKAFFRNAAGNVQRVWQRPAGGDAAKPSKPARGKGGASWLRNQAALKHQETASMPSPVWTANRPNAESLKAYAACPSSPNTIRPLILNKGCLG